MSATTAAPPHVSRPPAVVAPAGAGIELAWLGGRVTVLLTADESAGAMGMWRWLGNRGDATPWHVHEREDEEFVVVEGAARFFVGDDAHDVGAGGAVFLPRGVPHAYAIVSERAQVVGMVTPGGFEAFFTELGRPVPAGGPVPEGPSPAAMASALPARGVTLLGPPPAIG